MITRFSFRRWIAALSLGLTVPMLAGCAGRGQQVSQAEDGKFWRRTSAAQAEIAKPDAEEKADEAGRVRIASLGAEEETTEDQVSADPFLNQPEPTSKPVAQVAAEEPSPAPRIERKPTRTPADDRVAAIDLELERLRRDAMADEAAEDAEPSLEWADDVAAAAPKTTEVDATADEAPEQPTIEVAESPVAQEPAAEVEEVPMSREVAPMDAIDRAMIVDTLEINPRRIHDPSVRGTSGRRGADLNREIEPSTTRDALWSFERDDASKEVDATLIESTEKAPSDETPASKEAGDEVELAAASNAGTADAALGNPLLLPPGDSADEEMLETEIEEPVVPGLAGPSLLAPTVDDVDVNDQEPSVEDGSANAADAFPFDPAPEVVDALDALEFAEEPEAATTASNSSIGWWFGGFAIGAVVLLARARRRLFA